MPLGPGVRFRVKKTPKGNVRLAFRGNKVVEAVKMKGKGKLQGMLAKHIRDHKFTKKSKGKAPSKSKY